MRDSTGIRVRGAAAGLGIAVSALVAGCGGGGGDGGGSTGGGALTIVYPKAYSAFDGVHTFKVPVMVTGVTGVKWSASDPALVEIEALADDAASTGSEAMLVMKGAGTVTITAQAGTLEGKSTLTITQSAAAAWDTGKARYQDGISIRPMPGTGMPGQVNTMAACTNCHGTTLTDVEHTPAQIGGYTDAEVITIFTEGKKPAGVPNRVIPFEQWSPIHKWTMTEEEKQGIVTYLRSLEPQSQGTLDFGGRGVFRGPTSRGDGGPPPGNFGDGGPRRGDGGGGGPDAGAVND
jgi:hypothetical protein